MVGYKKAELQVLGEKLEVEEIGKGAFCYAYVLASNTNIVYLVVDTRDFSKDCFSVIPKTKHIPELEFIEKTPEGKRIFRSRYYAALSPGCLAWKHYQILNNDLAKAYREIIKKGGDGKDVGKAFNALVQDEPELPDSLKVAVEKMMGALIEYPAIHSLEICQCNLRVDEDGDLVLLDIAYRSGAGGL